MLLVALVGVLEGAKFKEFFGGRVLSSAGEVNQGGVSVRSLSLRIIKPIVGEKKKHNNKNLSFFFLACILTHFFQYLVHLSVIVSFLCSRLFLSYFGFLSFIFTPTSFLSFCLTSPGRF